MSEIMNPSGAKLRHGGEGEGWKRPKVRVKWRFNANELCIFGQK